MTNEQRNQVAAMNASGMSIDEIVLDTKLDRKEVQNFVAERNAARKGGRGCPISAQTRQAIVEWYQSGHSMPQTAKKFGVGQSSVYRIINEAQTEKEPTAAATATDSKIKILQVQDNTFSTESQALEGVNVLGVLQAALEAAYGKDSKVLSLKADSDEAYLIFRYGGKAYTLSFGLAF